MLPASNRGAGMNMGFPDVCLTPAAPSPIPVPYPNMAMNAMAAPFATRIILSGMPALNMASAIPMTMGDNAGVAHPFCMQRGAYTMGNPRVLYECLPAISLLMPTTGNMMNNPVGAVLVPSITTVYLSLRQEEGAEATPDLTSEDLADLQRRLADEEPILAEMLHENVGVLGVRVFTNRTASLTFRAVRKLRELGMKKLVIDLRDNPGGDLASCIDLLSDFCEPGVTLFKKEDTDGDIDDVIVHTDRLYDMPLVVLVNERTGSAAELFAAAIQSTGRGKIVGKTTYGKGTAQRIAAPPEGGPMRGTVATFYRADGSPIDGVGVTPDFDADDAVTFATTLLG